MDIARQNKIQNSELYVFLKIVVIFLIWLYLYTAIFNFFSPITNIIAMIILLLAASTLVLTYKKIDFVTFYEMEGNPYIKKSLIIITGIISIVWTVVVIFRGTIDNDANVYHFPLSILMNYSICYPSIGKLSHHFGFPNGNSVLASVFTSTNITGFENIPNLLIWFTLGVGIFLYLRKKSVNILFSLMVTFVFLLVPDMFWQSYNMGTDLPCTCFLLFGLLSLSEKEYEDTLLFFSLASVFKTLGLAAFLVTIGYVVILNIFKREKINLLNVKIVSAFLLFFVFLIRIYIETGNPFYTALPLNFSPWGISVEKQIGLANSLKVYPGFDRTLPGVFVSTKNFLFFPSRVKSCYWFVPFFLGCFILYLYIFLKDKCYKKINLHHAFMSILIIFLAMIWFIGPPLFRFIAGVLIFITIKMFIFLHKIRLPKLCAFILYGSLVITLFYYVENTARHIKHDAFPLSIFVSENKGGKMPFNEEIFSIRKTNDGFTYFRSGTTFCGRTKPPCINAYSIGNEDDLIREYRKYNKL